MEPKLDVLGKLICSWGKGSRGRTIWESWGGPTGTTELERAASCLAWLTVFMSSL